MPVTRLQTAVLLVLLVTMLVKGSADSTSHSHIQQHVAAGV